MSYIHIIMPINLMFHGKQGQGLWLRKRKLKDNIHHRRQHTKYQNLFITDITPNP